MNGSLSRHGRRQRHSQIEGFTLIEVLMVLVILVILGSISVPIYNKIRERAMINAAKAQVQLFESAIDMYHLSTYQYPSGLQDLVDRPSNQKVAKVWDGPYLKKNRNLIDPWEDPYQYTAKAVRSQSNYDVWSLGPDCQDGTGDDIGNWGE